MIINNITSAMVSITSVTVSLYSFRLNLFLSCQIAKNVKVIFVKPKCLDNIKCFTQSCQLHFSTIVLKFIVST